MSKPQTLQGRSITCFKCGQEGHRAAECKTSHPAKKTSPNPMGKPTKVQPQAKEMVLKGVEVVEFIPLLKRVEGTLTLSDDGQGLMDTDSDDNPLVSSDRIEFP